MKTWICSYLSSSSHLNDSSRCPTLEVPCFYCQTIPWETFWMKLQASLSPNLSLIQYNQSLYLLCHYSNMSHVLRDAAVNKGLLAKQTNTNEQIGDKWRGGTEQVKRNWMSLCPLSSLQAKWLPFLFPHFLLSSPTSYLVSWPLSCICILFLFSLLPLFYFNLLSVLAAFTHGYERNIK